MNFIKIKSIIIIIFVALAVFPYLARAEGATFYINPSGGEYTVGKNITAVIYVNSGGNKINAAEGLIQFPVNKLKVISVSRSNSIFSLWAVEPNFDNTTGTITFAGGNPQAFSGSSGKIISIVFSLKGSGESKINFSGGRILLADGSGTDVFAGALGSFWRLVAPQVVTPPSKPLIPEEAALPALLEKPTTTPEIKSEEKVEEPIMPLPPLTAEERIKILERKISGLTKLVTILIIIIVVLLALISALILFSYRFKKKRK